MSRPGFTLVELLLVIAIIAVLAGLLIPMISYAKRLAKESKAAAQLGGIQAALDKFKDANGFYPEGTGGNDAFKNAFKPNNTYKTAQEVTKDGGWEAVANELLQQLQTIDHENFRTLDSLRDPFLGSGSKSHVFRFRPAKFYPLKADADLLIDQADPPRADSYQLWSAGYDGKDQYGQYHNNRKSDDICNWKSK